MSKWQTVNEVLDLFLHYGPAEYKTVINEQEDDHKSFVSVICEELTKMQSLSRSETRDLWHPLTHKSTSTLGAAGLLAQFWKKVYNDWLGEKFNINSTLNEKWLK